MPSAEVDVNLMIVGAVVSITIVLPDAILVAGTVVLVIALPALSVTVPMLKLFTVKSLLVSPSLTV